MSPKQQRERRLELEQVEVNKIIQREWTLFYSDEGRRAKTVPELVAALRKLKTRLAMQLKAAKHVDWIENTAALIDMKIEEVQEKYAGEKPEEKEEGFWLPLKRAIKPDEN